MNKKILMSFVLGMLLISLVSATTIKTFTKEKKDFIVSYDFNKETCEVTNFEVTPLIWENDSLFRLVKVVDKMNDKVDRCLN